MDHSSKEYKRLYILYHDVLIIENVQKLLLRNVYEDYESSYDELFLKSS